MPIMSDERIAFIGAGNMARALIGGLLAAGHEPGRIAAADPIGDQRRQVAEDYGIDVHEDNAAAARAAGVVVLAVKPQVIDAVLESLSGRIPENTLTISVAAGIPIATIRAGLGADRPVIRAMPNTPALFGAGVTGLLAGPGVDEHQRGQCEDLFAAAGKVVWIEDEALMDVVTAVSGSGPAYFFALAEALAEAGSRAGLPAESSRALAVQTAVGAGVMLAEAGQGPAELRRRVTSPGGTTAAALEQLSHDEFAEIIDRAVQAAVRRGRDLGGGDG